jgi:Na+-transporting methylmalonyl-CoA/oxaloacetate decarboxylase gamma subunit
MMLIIFLVLSLMIFLIRKLGNPRNKD